MADHVDPAKRELSDAASGDQEALAADAPAEGLDTGGENQVRAQSLARRRVSATTAAVALGAAAVLTLGGFGGWLGYRTLENGQEQMARDELIDAARQGAVNLTTIDFNDVEADIQTILDSSTGTFRDDFQMRSGPFIDVVKQTESISEGTVTAAGVETYEGDQALVLVAVSVKTSNNAEPEQQPRSWRMRINVHKVDDDIKVADIQFVP
jgi:Mce-associated membrane protein